MDKLKRRIIDEGQVLSDDVVRVDSFLNQRIDPDFMVEMANEFGLHFNMNNVSLILTVESSGIALASICAQRYSIPMVFVKKGKSSNMDSELYQCDIFSYTYKKPVTLCVSKYLIAPHDRILIIDDFIANGEVVSGLCKIINMAGATLVGVGCAIEKGFQKGGKWLRDQGIDVKSLAIIEKISSGGIFFKND